MISEKEWQEAEECARRETESGMIAIKAFYDAEKALMHVTMKRGFTISFPKERSQVLSMATDEQLSEVVVEGTGRYIIFPKLDDGFTVEGLLSGRFGNVRWEQEWADKHQQLTAA